MRKLAAGVIVAAMALMIAATPSTDQAQQAVATPTGEALQAKAEKIRDAFLKGKPDDIPVLFAPWMQGRFALLHAEMPTEQAKMTAADKASFAKAWKNRASEDGGMRSDPDPSDMLKIVEVDDFLKLSGAQVLAMHLGYYRVHGGAVTQDRLDAKWFLVDRSIGFEQYEEKFGKESRWLSRTRGRVTFMAAGSRDGFIVTCVAEGAEWQVVDFEYRLGPEGNSVSKGMQKQRWDKLGRGGLFSAARRSEGEQIMASLKGQARVSFAKTGNAPATLTVAGVAAIERKGMYFNIRDKVVSDRQSFKLMCEPVAPDSEDGFCVGAFKWAGGDGTFTWYDTLEDLYAAHPEFK